MFDTDLDDLDTADLLTAATEYAQTQEHAAVAVLRTAQAFADRNAVLEWLDGQPLPGTERLRVYGGEGCPGVAEFAVVEFGSVLGMSGGAAASLIGEALALRHRLPRVWAAVLAGNAVSWRARKIAHACLPLSLEACAIVDRRVAGIVNTITPGRLATIVTAALWQADPDRAQAHAEAAARTRGVFVAQSEADDDHGTKRIWVRAATGDVIRFDATINDLAQALKLLGDPDTLDQRRAKAIGWIADPEAAHHLLQVTRYLARHHTHTQRAHTAQPPQPTPTPQHPHPHPHPRPRPTSPADQARPANPAHPAKPAGPNAPADPANPASPDASASPATSTAPDSPVDPANAGDAAAADEPVTDEPRGEPVADDEAWADMHARYEDRVANEDGLPNADCADDLNGLGAAGDGEVFTRLALADTLEARLAAIKQDAYSNGLGNGTGSGKRSRRSRRNRHTLYVHLTDTTLATGTGVLRVEELGPLLASQLTELLGHDQVVVKPVIDLHDQVSVHAYEIPDRIRERVRLRHPVDMFPYGTAEATISMDLDHITPYDRTGPPGQPGQTNTDNLIPQSRLHHRAKTFGGWSNQRLPNGAIEWTSPHGFRFHVDHTGTHQLPPRQTDTHRRRPRPGS